jgi:uncharacterized membrane protein
MGQRAASNPPRLLAAFVSLAGLLLSCASDDGDPAEGAAGSAGAAGAAGAPNATGTVSWCEVREVLEAKCQRCHVDEGLHGAPFPLVAYSDTQADMGGRPRWQFMEPVVKAESMPPTSVPLEPPVEKLTSAELTLLLTWFDEGAEPVGGLDCSP